MSVIPVKTGIQNLIKHWIPRTKCGAGSASAGMTSPKDPLFPLFFQRAKLMKNL
jgi:hypothetical protein